MATKSISKQPIVVLDACVLYKAPVRDLLLSIAAEQVIKVKWSKKIQDEWSRNLLINRPDLNKAQLEKTKEAMNEAFPEAEDRSARRLSRKIKLPDENDRHVVACALACEADFIVTFNISDFPLHTLQPLYIYSIHPDLFIKNLMRTNLHAVCRAFEKMHARLNNPPMSKKRLLLSLANCGLAESSNEIETNCRIALR